MIEVKINFEQIDQRVKAAWSLQAAGQDKQAKEILLSLANDIIKTVIVDQEVKA